VNRPAQSEFSGHHHSKNEDARCDYGNGSGGGTDLFSTQTTDQSGDFVVADASSGDAGSAGSE